MQLFSIIMTFMESRKSKELKATAGNQWVIGSYMKILMN